MQTTDANDGSELELLSFKVGAQEYSVDIMSVREIRGWTKTTPLPHAPPFMCGVINLRGTVLPVLDLAKRLGIEPESESKRRVIIVVQSNDRPVGLLVDAVSDILSIPLSDMQPPPEMSADTGPAYISALTLVDGRMIRVLDLIAVLPDTTKSAA